MHCVSSTSHCVQTWVCAHPHAHAQPFSGRVTTAAAAAAAEQQHFCVAPACLDVQQQSVCISRGESAGHTCIASNQAMCPCTSLSRSAKPWVHYVPFQSGSQAVPSLLEAVQQLQANDTLAQQISQAGQTFASK